MSSYLRVAALGDSTTVGIGDRVPGGWRGWLRLLVDELSASYDVSLCSTARVGATTPQLRSLQLGDAVAHRPELASLVIGGNDVLRSGWSAQQTHEDLMACADALAGVGALLLTIRYHDHPTLVGLPGPVRRPLSARLAAVNAAYDDVHATYGGLRVDLAEHPEVHDPACWSVDRLHPSERGHRALARAYAELLRGAGYDLALPAAESSGGLVRSWRSDVRWAVVEGGPWAARRARDLGPWAAQLAWSELGASRRPRARLVSPGPGIGAGA